MEIINELVDEGRCKSTSSFVNRLHEYYTDNTIIPSQVLTNQLINRELIEEIRNIPEDVSVSFGKCLRDIKCSIKDEGGIREHEIYLRYKGNHKFRVTDVKLPYSQHQDREYSSISEVITVYRNYIRTLTAYFQELENIDKQCTVVEPIKPSFKDDYRRILLDSRIWLHIEVTPEGLARNIHLNRQSEQFYDKLHVGLLSWDHDKNIVENINRIFDLANISVNQETDVELVKEQIEVPSCSICFCVNLPESNGLPQPLCQNPKCEVYYHKYCLYQWLVACEGGRPPAFGVAYGSCPTCLQLITCSEQ
ncbi:E3 ubiquitin-protein ligase FANCL isoform X1 [Bicyclus anynana]|uniref:E3 ubiquitin-protein ligase FANCL isoform X1 n=1 Tax=Bicyclus anynana TaxID=110368 RepID=A0A6J1N1G5_BICAN|nr:E3 ubiquitin-protein ligase FANCL isoform X1 [Bicyclus anynana]